ncbi:hypothetical protein B2J93_3190 [Marssonina coronariae]|uniref:MARVEL domain-containing protein n=1 Tax=Diplocarpon coronariae TaxID=2795749 RepID=A0A218Z3R2_9HELO|nr:hypothetical protein B2J93_3190 [Marssonina coronariae]
MVSQMAWIHIVQIALIQAALGVAAYMQFFLPKPKVQVSGRGTTFVFGVVRLPCALPPAPPVTDREMQGAKSLVFIAYQVLSKKYNKWYSPKANFIINCLEVVFWAAVVFMGIQSNTQSCVGTHCTLSWITIVLGGIISLVTTYAAYVSWFLFQAHKAQKMGLGGKDVEMSPTGYQTASIVSDDFPANKTYPTNNPFPPAANQSSNPYPASQYPASQPGYANNQSAYQTQERYNGSRY